MSIGERLKAARKKRGISQDELAKSIGVSRGVITNIEYDKVNTPQPIILEAMVQKLKIRKEWLIEGQGDMDNNSDVLQSAKTLA